MQGCNYGTFLNISQKYPNLRVIDKTSLEYQLEGIVYACVMLFMYLMATAGFMIQFIAVREPSENELSGDMQILKKFEKHDAQFARETRRNIKKQVIQHLQTVNGAFLKSRSETQSTRFNNLQKKRSLVFVQSIDDLSLLSKTTSVTFYDSDTLVSL